MSFTIARNDKNADLYLRAREIKAQIAVLEAEYQRLAATLAAAPSEVGKVEVEGIGSFVVSENNTYDETVMRETLSPGQVRRCSVSRLDKATVKRLYPDVYAAAKRTLGRKVTIGG